jgi:hypothetical protein
MVDSKKVWKCLNCTEEVEEQFDLCWNCGATGTGSLPTTSLSAQDLEDREQKSFLNKKYSSKNCVRCDVVLTYAGTREFHEGMNLGVLGDFAELFVSQTKLEMYVCPNCFRVEFFATDLNR